MGIEGGTRVGDRPRTWMAAGSWNTHGVWAERGTLIKIGRGKGNEREEERESEKKKGKRRKNETGKIKKGRGDLGRVEVGEAVEARTAGGEGSSEDFFGQDCSFIGEEI